MKKLILICLVIGMALSCKEGNAQISFKTEYIGNSAYMYASDGDESSKRVGNSEGSAIIYHGMANIPFYMKKDEKGRPTAWGIGVDGAYVSFNNKNFTDDMVSKIMNLQLGIFHVRPLSDKWSMKAGIGMGIYAPFTEFSKIKYKNVLGSAGVIFIRRMNPNLDLGGGVMINSTFGYPMAFPAFYFDWRYGGKFKIKASLGEGLKLSVGYGFNDYFSLSAIGEMSGQMALLKKEGKDVIFIHQYIITGLRPEIKLGKTGITMPIIVGINASRPAYYSNRTLKGMFATNNNYYFRLSPYASIGIKYGF